LSSIPREFFSLSFLDLNAGGGGGGLTRYEKQTGDSFSRFPCCSIVAVLKRNVDGQRSAEVPVSVFTAY
jgi:hypothetical protein